MEPFPLQVAVAHGAVPDEVLDMAEEKVRHVARLAPAPVLFARVAVTHDEDPAVRRRVVAKATLDVNGRLVRAHVAAEHFGEAIDLLEARLRHGLEVLTEHRQARRMVPPASPPGEWHHGSLPTVRPDHYPRPVEQRQVVRRKTWELTPRPVEDAAVDLDLLDLDWLLFTEAETGQDMVIERAADGYRLLVAGTTAPVVGDLAAPVAVHTDVPTRTLDEAIDQLVLGEVPLVFSVDADTGRGAVLYLRYDGHYGLVEPALAPVPAEPR